MYLALLTDARLHALLRQLDEELAATIREAGCPCCGGVLHWARYPRKPRGLSPPCRPQECRRLSFCCATDACRKRTTPPSVYFLGRKVYLSTVVVLVSAMRCGATPARMQRLSELVGASRRTLSRWQTWWRRTMPASAFWRSVSGSLMPPVVPWGLPLSLLERFAGDLEHRLIALLRFVAPMSGSNTVPTGPVVVRAL